MLPRLLPREERGYSSLTSAHRFVRVPGMMASPNEGAWKGQRSLQEVTLNRQHNFLFLQSNLQKNACFVLLAWKHGNCTMYVCVRASLCVCVVSWSFSTNYSRQLLCGIIFIPQCSQTGHSPTEKDLEDLNSEGEALKQTFPFHTHTRTQTHTHTPNSLHLL